MRTIFKKATALFLALTMVIGCLSTVAWADETLTDLSEENEVTTLNEVKQPEVVSFAVTNKEHDDADKELNQTIIITVDFDEAITLGAEPAKDLDILISGGNVASTARTVTCEVNPENAKQLVITLVSTDWVAIYGGKLNVNASADGIKNIFAADGTTPVAWTNLETYLPIGIVLELEQTVGTAATPASTTVNVAHKANMRGMYHVSLLSNGQDVINDTSYFGSTITSHAHAFYTSITRESIANAIASQINKANAGYTAVYTEGTQLTVTANAAVEGETITVQMFEYNEDNRTVDPLLKSAVASAEKTLNSGIIYTDETIAAVMNAEAAVNVLVGTNPSLKDQADAKAALSKAVAGLERKTGLTTETGLRSTGASKTGTGKVSFRLNNFDAVWAASVNQVTVDGVALEEGSYSITEADGLVFDSSVFAKGDRESYDIVLSSPYYNAISETVTVNNYGAKKFYVRLVDAGGKVLKSAAYTMDEMKEMSTAKDVYYQTVCGMRGVTSFKATGVYVEDLLAKSGITFGEGMTFKLRTNDSASTNDSETEDGYYRMGSFTYESLMGTTRYAFPELYTNEELKTNLLAALEVSRLGEEVRTILGKSEKAEVKPMLAYQYLETIYASSQDDMSTAEYSDLITAERAFRFLFGVAMDADNADMIAGQTTTWSASYCAFGFDIVLPYKSIEGADVAAISSVTYTGSAQTPEVKVTYGETELVKDTDYTVAYSNNTKAGTATVTITGMGEYTGTLTTSFEIKAKSISSAKAALSYTSTTYSGNTKSPSVTLTLGSKTLKKNTDYTVSYKNNKSIGTATVTITGKGNYKSTLTKTFKIVPKKAVIKSAAAGKKQIKVTVTKQTGSVKYQFAIRKSTSSKYSYYKTSNTYKTFTKLTTGKKYVVKVRAYKVVSGKTYYGAWSSTKTVTAK